MALVPRTWIVGIAIPLASFIALAPRVCGATPPAAEPPTEVKPSAAKPPPGAWRWYGWHTLAADSVAGALYLGAVADDHNSLLFGLSGVSFGLGAPAIHLSHGRWGVAMGSVGLRILGPFVGYLIGAGADVRASQNPAGSVDTHGKWAAFGAGFGGLTVAAIDAAFLAYDTPESQRRKQSALLASLPELMVMRQGFGLGYSGRF